MADGRAVFLRARADRRHRRDDSDRRPAARRRFRRSPSAFTVSPALALGVAIFFFVQQQVENHVLVPKIMERQVGVSAVVVIIALLIGGSLLGIVGAILAVPTAAILQVLLRGARRRRPRRTDAACRGTRSAALPRASRSSRPGRWRAGSDATCLGPRRLVLVMWILAWDCEQLLAILSGDFSRIAHVLRRQHLSSRAADARLFGAPLRAGAADPAGLRRSRGNPILCYNLLFLSTFVLSGSACTCSCASSPATRAPRSSPACCSRSRRTGFRSRSHLQVLSSQWMPFALYGFRRYFDDAAGRRGRWPAAAGRARAAEPVVRLLPAVLRAVRRGVRAVGDRRAPIAGATRRMWLRARRRGAVVAVADRAVPAAVRGGAEQLEHRRGRGGSRRDSPRTSTRTPRRSASSASGAASLRGVSRSPKAISFPGWLPLLLALIGVWHGGGRRHGQRSDRRGPSACRRRLVRMAARSARAIVHVVAAHCRDCCPRRITFDLGLFELRMSNVNQLLLRAAVGAGAAGARLAAARGDRVAAFMRDARLLRGGPARRRCGCRSGRCRRRSGAR